MIARGVERVEAVVLRLDFRSVGDDETDLAQDAAHLFAHEGQRVKRARTGIGRRERRINGGPELGGEFRGGDAGERGVELGGELGLGLVNQLADRRPLLLGHGPHLFHQAGQLAMGADVAGFGGLEFGARRHRGQFCGGLGQEGGELVLHEMRKDWVNHGSHGSHG